MSIAHCCPYSDGIESCKYEKFWFHPRLDKCPTCDRKKKADEKPATSLHLLANKELREELEKLKKENEQLKIENVKMRCCGNCTHRNAEEVVETCKLLKKYTQVKGACDKWSFAEDRENGLALHNLKENPNDLPTRSGEYLTNIGVLDFDNALGNRWHTLLCEACDYYEDVTDEVTVWCELPKLEV